jgi:hypothetical protein
MSLIPAEPRPNRRAITLGTQRAEIPYTPVRIRERRADERDPRGDDDFRVLVSTLRVGTHAWSAHRAKSRSKAGRAFPRGAWDECE